MNAIRIVQTWVLGMKHLIAICVVLGLFLGVLIFLFGGVTVGIFWLQNSFCMYCEVFDNRLKIWASSALITLFLGIAFMFGQIAKASEKAVTKDNEWLKSKQKWPWG